MVSEYAGKEEIRDNLVSEITQAWSDEARELTVCVQGWPAWRSRSLSPVDYHMTLPLALFEDPEQPSPLFVQDERRIKAIAIPAERMADGCPEKPDGAADVRTNSINADYFAGVPPREASDAQIEQFVDPDNAEIALFSFAVAGEPPSVAIMYRHNEEAFEGSRLVWINPVQETVTPNKAAYLALPVAVAVDVVIVAGAILVLVLGVFLGG